MVNRASAAAVSLVSSQLNLPAPKMVLTIWARRTINKTLTGIDQNIICLDETIICRKKLSLCPDEKSRDKVGKAAIE